ncbi:MAG: 1-phosphofructokinase family hexose kinase [Microthrixaceae bacterium]
MQDGPTAAPAEDRRAVAVFSPAPHLEISVELSADDEAEVHVHPGGQGYWIARMIDTLGAVPWLCAPVGGELGAQLRVGLSRLPDVGLIEVATPTPARIVDRRQDRRGESWVQSPPSALDRHELDDLFTRTLGLAVECGVCVVSGTGGDATVPVSVFERLARDLAAVGVTVVADISGDELAALLDGAAPDVVKLSDEELVADGWAGSDDVDSLRKGIDALHERGVDTVVITRAGNGALLAHDRRLHQLTGPEFSPVNSRGAGDSLTAAVATLLARGADPVEAVRLGVAAGALNATRHGLGSGERDAIEALAAQIEIEEVG